MITTNAILGMIMITVLIAIPFILGAIFDRMSDYDKAQERRLEVIRRAKLEKYGL